MILLHGIDKGRELLICIKYISFIEEIEGGSKIEYKDSHDGSNIYVKESPSQILSQINQNK